MNFLNRWPELGTEPISVEPMISAEFFEKERTRLFGRTWLKVAREEELPAVGDYKVKRIDVMNTSIIIVRGKDNVVRAFHNICPHRGNKILQETSDETFGNARAGVISCRFHGWVFGTDGALRFVPERNKFPNLKEDCLELKPVACDIWQGFIFVCFAREPETSLQEFLGRIDHYLGGYPYAESTTAFRYSTTLKCNWKVALYAFTEAYHVATIHAGTLPDLARVEHTEFDVMGPHSTSSLYALLRDTAKPKPATGVFAQQLHRSPAHQPRLDDLPKAINPERRKDFQFAFPTVFPNLLILLGAGNGYPGMTYFTHQFWPISVDETLWEGINYFRKPATPAEFAAMTHINALHRNAWLEDTSTMEDTHAALQSRVLSEMPLMDEELMIRNTHINVQRYVDREL